MVVIVEIAQLVTSAANAVGRALPAGQLLLLLKKKIRQAEKKSWLPVKLFRKKKELRRKESACEVLSEKNVSNL